MSLNREKLKSSIRDFEKDEKLFHYLETGLPFNVFSSEPAIGIPFKLQAFKELRNLCEKKTGEKKQPSVISIDATHFSVNSQTLMKSVEKMFQTKLSNINVNIKAALHCLVLCENTEAYIHVLNLESVAGSFGCMLLNLPIEKDPSEALATIKYKTETIVLELRPNSLLTVSGPRHNQGRQDIEVKPANGKRCAILVFHLVWVDAFSLSSFLKPDTFCTFIKAASEAQEALEAWIKPQQPRERAPTTPATKARMKSTGQEARSTLSPQIDATTPQFLCIPLINKYSPYDVKMNRLEGIDLFTSHVLKSIDYLDVSLAVLSCPAKGYKPLKCHSRSTLCKRRVSQRKIKELPLIWSSCGLSFRTVTLDKQLVWSITSKLNKPTNGRSVIVLSNTTSRSIESGSASSTSDSDEYSDTESETSVQFVSLKAKIGPDASSHGDSPIETEATLSAHRSILPNHSSSNKRNKASKIYSASDLSSEESYSEEEYYNDCFHKYNICYKCDEKEEPGTEHAVLLIKPKWNRTSSINIKDTIEDLKSRLVNALILTDDGILPENKSFTSDFLLFVNHVCCTKEEVDVNVCLEILNIAIRLGKFLVDAVVPILNVIANSKHPIQDILQLTDFILIAGWESCSDAVLRMVDITDFSFANLGKQLFYLRCLDGAAQLAEKIIEKMSTGNHKQHELSLIASIAELVCILEQEMASKTRYGSLLNYLKKHDMDMLRRAIAKAQETTLEKELLSKLLTDVSESSAGVRLNEIEIPAFVSIIKKYGHCSENIKVIDSLMKQVFDEVEAKRANTFLHRLITSLKRDEDRAEVLKQMGRYSKASKVIDLTFESFAKIYDGPFVDDNGENSDPFQSYLKFLSLAENQKQLTSQKRMGLIEKLLLKLTTRERLSIVFQFRENAGRKQLTAGEKKLYGALLQVVLKTSVDAWFLSINDLLGCFIWLDDKVLIESLVCKLTQEKDDCDGLLVIDCLRSIFSSEQLPALEQSQVLTLLKTWAKISSHSDACVINEDMPLIFKAFFKAERAGVVDAEIPEFIRLMLPKIDSSSLKHLVVQVEDKQRLKKLTTCFNVFREICSELATRQDFTQVCLEQEATHLERLTLSFLWLGDEKPVTQLLEILSSIAPGSKLHKTKLNILKCADVHEAAKCSSSTFQLFISVFDDYVNKMRDLLKAPETWALPNAVFPREPEVQQFLREDSQHYSFIKKRKQRAEGYCKKITNFCSLWGLQYSMRSTGSDEYRCEISKTRKFPGVVPYIHGVTSELARLIELRKTLVAREEPASKRQKL